MDHDSKGRVRGQGLVQDGMILEPFPPSAQSMSYLFFFFCFFLRLCCKSFPLLFVCVCVLPCFVSSRLCQRGLDHFASFMFALDTGGGLRISSTLCSGSADALGLLFWCLPDLRVFSLPCCVSAAGSHCRVGKGIDKPPMRKGGHVDARALHLSD